MIVIDKGDHYEISVNHCVVIAKDQPLGRFKQYLHDIYLEFDREITTTMFQVVREDIGKA